MRMWREIALSFIIEVEDNSCSGSYSYCFKSSYVVENIVMTGLHWLPIYAILLFSFIVHRCRCCLFSSPTFVVCYVHEFETCSCLFLCGLIFPWGEFPCVILYSHYRSRERVLREEIESGFDSDLVVYFFIVYFSNVGKLFDGCTTIVIIDIFFFGFDFVRYVIFRIFLIYFVVRIFFIEN